MARGGRGGGATRAGRPADLNSVNSTHHKRRAWQGGAGLAHSLIGKNGMEPNITLSTKRTYD